VGTNVSHNLPLHLARLKALEAAEKRRKLGSLGEGGRRLGGSVGEQRRMTPRELAARVNQFHLVTKERGC
jgi:DNA-dependent metalloprotease WSS1